MHAYGLASLSQLIGWTGYRTAADRLQLGSKAGMLALHNFPKEEGGGSDLTQGKGYLVYVPMKQCSSPVRHSLAPFILKEGRFPAPLGL